jgi:hypothetical protein
MGKYTAEHLSALADIRAAGTDVTFTLSVTTTDETTGIESTAVVSTVTGAALRVTGAPQSYGPGDLTVSAPTTLLFGPDTYGERPALGSTVDWEGATWTAKSVGPISPDGTDIISRVVVI